MSDKKNVKPRWVWLPASPTGGTGGGAYSKLFRNDALPPSDLLAREVLQNSWDAAQVNENSEGPPFRFSFRFAELSGKSKSDFLTTLDLKSLIERRGTIEDDRDIPGRDEVERIGDSTAPLRLLYLEDYGTHGMFGDPAKGQSSHLFKALYVLGSTGKDREAGAQGGSFGFGKSAFIGTSGLRVAVAHTRFARRTGDEATQRLIGFTWWGEHTVDGKSFEGRAMFGEAASQARLGAKPLVDARAQEIGRKLGMPNRSTSPSSLGSTILIVNPLVGAEQINDSVEKYWWPALEEQAMDVVVETCDGEILVPRPRTRRDLQPFLRAYGIATGLESVRNPREEALASSKWRADSEGVKYGSLALVVDEVASPSDSDSNSGVGNLESPLVALIRGPRMVIEYKTFGSRLPIRGVFVADPAIDDNLRDVEPPSHNTWDGNFGADVSGRSQEVARGLLGRIRRAVRDFAQEFTPPPTDVPTDLRLFGDLLSKFFSGRVPGPPLPISSSTNERERTLNFRIARTDLREVTDEGMLVLNRWLSVRVPQDEAWNRATLELQVRGAIAWDLGARASDPLELSVTPPQGFIRIGDTSQFVGEVTAGEDVAFAIRTAPYPKDLTILIIPEGELRSSEAGAANGETAS